MASSPDRSPAADGVIGEAVRAAIPAPGAIAGTLSPDGVREVTTASLADVEGGVPMRPSTPARIGSITKTFTSAAVVALAERGALGVDDPAALHLPELRALRTNGFRLEEVTIRRLLLHTSGLISEPPGRDWFAFPFPSIGALLERIADAYLAIEPGCEFKYSNLGYALLGEIVARASGRSCERFVQDALLGPAGMTATTFDEPTGSARGHAPQPRGAWAALPFQELGAERPGGGMWSTAEDLLRWAEVALGRAPDVLAPTMAALLARPEAVRDATPGRGRSLGWQLWRSGERILHGHVGQVTGFSAMLAFDRDAGSAAVVLANSHLPCESACRALLGVEAAPAEPAPVVVSTPQDPVGVYAAPLDAVVHIERRDEALWISGGLVDVPGGTPLEPLDSDRFVGRAGRLAGEPLTLQRAPDGAVEGFSVGGWNHIRV